MRVETPFQRFKYFCFENKTHDKNPDFPGGEIALERVCVTYGFKLHGPYGVIKPENRFDPQKFARLPKYLMVEEAKKKKPRSNTGSFYFKIKVFVF